MIRRPAIPRHVLCDVQLAVAEQWNAGQLVSELRNKGIVASVPTARRWLHGFRGGSYRVVEPDWKTVPLPPPQFDTLLSLAERGRQSMGGIFSAIDRAASGKPAFRLHTAIVGDEHLPDHDPVAVELAQRIVTDWFTDSDASLLLRAGDVFDFPDLGRWKNLPIALRQPGHPLVDPMTLTVSTFESVQAGWAQTGRQHEVMLMGNHDVRFFKYLHENAGPLFEFGAVELVNRPGESGTRHPRRKTA